MIDPITSLVFAIHANPGAYAVLIGSGISSSASIPTGWQIVEDLVRRVAHGHCCIERSPRPSGILELLTVDATRPR